jgi:NSS family neurotransmitter:Na+ symporter
MSKKSSQRGSFNSNFGFLMAAVGSAVGLGNIWGFPYKMGMNGGFAFIIIYIAMAIFLGYPLMIGEIALGRKTGKSAIDAYRDCDPRFTFNGVFETIVPFLLLCFYCVLGGLVMKYMIVNFGDIFHASWGVNGTDPSKYFGNSIGHVGVDLAWMFGFLIITAVIIMGGVSSGIEKFSKVAMPALYLLLLITAIRCCTLKGAVGGLKFMFKPDFSALAGTGWLKVMAAAGSQLFFSLSLASGCLIAFGSYMQKEDDLQKSAFMIPLLDTIAALAAGLCVMPAVFAEGLKPAGGPGLLFVSLQYVFQKMGAGGAVFGFIFYLLVFIAALSSSIGMMEGGVAAMIDSRLKRGKSSGRTGMVLLAICTTCIGAFLVAYDQLGGNTHFWKPFGMGSWLDVFDLGAEGILMPLGGLIMAVLFGWVHYGYLNDEVQIGSNYGSRKFVNFCFRWICPIVMAFIVFVQISSFFFSKTGWYMALFG